MDIIAEFNSLFFKIIMQCAFGTDLENRVHEYVEDGKVSKIPLGKFIRQVFGRIIARTNRPQSLFAGAYL